MPPSFEPMSIDKSSVNEGKGKRKWKNMYRPGTYGSRIFQGTQRTYVQLNLVVNKKASKN